MIRDRLKAHLLFHGKFLRLCQCFSANQKLFCEGEIVSKEDIEQNLHSTH